MKVYVLTENWREVYGENEVGVVVFKTIEQATKELKTRIKEAQKEFCDCETSYCDYIEGDMSWGIEDLDQSSHYDYIEIFEREVIEND